MNRETLLAWFQWIAERMTDREEEEPAVPAYLAHAKWKP